MALHPALAQAGRVTLSRAVSCFQKQCISVGRTWPRLIKTLPITSLAPCHPNMTRLLWVLGAARTATACCSSHKQGLPGGSPERHLSKAHKCCTRFHHQCTHLKHTLSGLTLHLQLRMSALPTDPRKVQPAPISM